MGLTIHYDLQSKVDGPQQVRELVARLHKRALSLPLARVGHVLELRGSACDCERYDRQDANRWLLIQARQFSENSAPGDQDSHYPVAPRHLIAFSSWPGEGCEQANFGLCLYPRTVRVTDRRRPGYVRLVRTGLTGWQWSSFCKTQSASSPQYGGVEHFLRCHLSIIALLEYAQELQILSDVADEGDFWQQRSVEALARQVGEWNSAMAARVSQLQDRQGAALVAELGPLATGDQQTTAARGKTRRP